MTSTVLRTMRRTVSLLLTGTVGVVFAQTTGSIEGTVTDGTGAAVSGLTVQAVQFDFPWSSGQATTAGDGSYRIDGLAVGAYRVETGVHATYPQVAYDGVAARHPTPSVEINPVSVAAGATVTGIDFTVEPGGRIEMTLDCPGLSAFQLTLGVYDECGVQRAVTTGLSCPGTGTTSAVPPGSYLVQVERGYGPSLLSECWPDVLCPPGSDPRAGNPVTVVAHETTALSMILGADATLDLEVRDAVTDAEVTGYRVLVFDDRGEAVTEFGTGTRYVAVTHRDYVDQLVGGGPFSPSDSDPTVGLGVSVVAGSTTGPIAVALQPGGRIAGTVTSTEGDPISGLRITLYDPCGTSYWGSATTDSGGSWTSPPLPEGWYAAKVSSTSDWIGATYGGPTCESGCPVGLGTPIAVTNSTMTAGIDFTLAEQPDVVHGSISGTVTVADTGDPVQFATVVAALAPGDVVGLAAAGYSTSTLADGSYELTGLPAGEYRVVTFTSWSLATRLVDEMYDGAYCPRSEACNDVAGDLVMVAGGAATSGIDFSLEVGAVLGGTVVAGEDGCPRFQAGNSTGSTSANVYDTSGREIGFAWWASGDYVLGDAVPAGTYHVVGESWAGGQRTAYGDSICPEATCDPTATLPVTVVAGERRTDLVITSPDGGAISGRVVDAASGAAKPWQRVEIIAGDGSIIETMETGSTQSLFTAPGAFRTHNDLGNGTYYLRTRNSIGLIDELYDGIPCPGGACDPTVGTPIVISGAMEVDVGDLVLDVGGMISGRVLDAETLEPVVDVSVLVYNDVGVLVSESMWCSGGWRTANGLPTGTYYAVATSDSHRSQRFDGKVCQGPCDPTRGTPIEVVVGEVTEGVDFFLKGLPPGLDPNRELPG